MRERLARFMAGRNGNDQLNTALLILDLFLLLIASIFSKTVGKIAYPAAMVLLVYTYFRMFSRNLPRRREENGRFMRWKYKLGASYRVWHERWVQRKDYKFFTCPSCHTTLRVPRGHGKLKIVCKKCGSSFEGRS